MGVLGSRRVLDCSSKKVPSRHNQTTQPDLFLIQTPPGTDATTGEDQSWRTWASCLSPIEAKPHHKAIKRAADEANHTLRKSDREQVASYAQEVFGAQDNRRFCYVLLITEEILRVHMFDHSGVIFHEFAYHAHPEKFCAVISEIAGPQDKARGFDISLDLLVGARRILMPLSGTQYLAKTEIFRSYSLIGEGVVTWLAHAQSRPGRDVIIKDSWEITPGFEQLILQRALARGVLNGIGHIIEFTSLPDDSIRLNRGYQPLSTLSDPDARFIDRTHCRTVYDIPGWPIEYFRNPRDILVAFRDAISAHRELYLKANILHSYITPSSIFFNPKATEGSRGILINFQHACLIPHQGYVTDDNMKSIIAQTDPDISNRILARMHIAMKTKPLPPLTQT
ncbi:hypothetical protein K439DRAFT_659199 [Ramaria rubella]|nr:hypothetical protein K439DRAFT_659199 [Ramaria rubella]